MPRPFQLPAWVVTASAFAAGCSNDTGVVPIGGYDMTPVVYKKNEPKPNLQAAILQIPAINPLKYPDQPAELPEPRVWKKSMPIAFVGEVELTDDKTDGAWMRIEISRLRSDGTLGHTDVHTTLGRLKEGEDSIPYRLDCRAPSEPGRYFVAIKTIGPSLDIEALDTFVAGEVDVQ